MAAPVSAVCVTFDSARVVERALASVVDDPLVEAVFVVDNASRDGTPERIARRFGERVRVVANPTNTGFGAAANRGLALVETPFALLLNPDAVSDPAALATLVETATRHPKSAIVGPALQDSEGRAQKSFTATVFERERGAGPPALPAGDESVAVPFIPAAYWLMRMTTCEQLRGFDESIFLYYEDDDYCLRVSQAGGEIRHVPKARIVHDVGTGSEDSAKVGTLRQFHLLRSRMRVEHKHRGPVAGLRLRATSALRNGGKALLHAASGRGDRARRSWARLQGCLFDAPLSG